MTGDFGLKNQNAREAKSLCRKEESQNWLQFHTLANPDAVHCCCGATACLQ